MPAPRFRMHPDKLQMKGTFRFSLNFQEKVIFMNTIKFVLSGLPLVVIVCAGCAAISHETSQAAKTPTIPDALRQPTGHALAKVLSARGVQIYECVKAPQGLAFEWKFKAPEAELSNGSGQVVGKHYGGPTWESIDGSTVVGQLSATVASTHADAIPLLLLNAKSNTGAGMFSNVRSIQRLETKGGKGPLKQCTPDNLAEIVRAHYEATYYFYE